VSIFAAGVVIAAVIDRRRTQEAVHLDISQRELASFLIGEVIMSEQGRNLDCSSCEEFGSA